MLIYLLLGALAQLHALGKLERHRFSWLVQVLRVRSVRLPQKLGERSHLLALALLRQVVIEVLSKLLSLLHLVLLLLSGSGRRLLPLILHHGALLLRLLFTTCHISSPVSLGAGSGLFLCGCFLGRVRLKTLPGDHLLHQSFLLLVFVTCDRPSQLHQGLLRVLIQVDFV